VAARRVRPLIAVAAGSLAHSDVHLGVRVRELRRRRGWSIEEAAGRAGLSRNTLGNLETAVLPNPNLSTLLALMEVYELRSIEELFGSMASRVVLERWVAEGRPGARR
jgi:transcriptional regulator with XRE-family HTH domain